MTKLVQAALTLMFVFTLAAQSPADVSKEAGAVLDKAIKAMGGEKKLAEAKTVNWKGKGKIFIEGNENDFTSETTIQGLDHLRGGFEGNFGGNEIKAVTVVAGDKGWRSFAGMKMEMDADALANEKRMIYLQLTSVTILPLRQKEFKVEIGATVKVGGREAQTLKVTGPDKKDFTIHFDAETGLPTKMVAKVVGFAGDEFTQETTYDGYKDFDGIKKATKIASKREGERFVEYEITDFKVLDKADAATFKEPD
jgi:hypothetical protein